MNAQGASSPSHGGSAGTEGRGTDGEGRCTDHSIGSARHGSGRAGEAGKAKDAVKGSAKGLHCKKESMKKVPNGKSELELQELDPKKVRRILANRQSAAKSKERRAQVTGSLEAQISGMEEQREGLARHCQGLRQDCERLDAFTQDMGVQSRRLEYQLAQLTLQNRGLISELASTQTLARLPRSVPNVRFTDSVQLPPMPTLLYPTPLDPNQASLPTAPPHKPLTNTLSRNVAVHTSHASAAATDSAAPRASNTPVSSPADSRGPAAFEAAQTAWDGHPQGQRPHLDDSQGRYSGVEAGSFLKPAAGSDKGNRAHSSALGAAPEQRIDLQGLHQRQAAQHQEQPQQQQPQLQQHQQQQPQQPQQQQPQYQQQQQQQCLLSKFTEYQGQQQQQQQQQHFPPTQQAISSQPLHHSFDEQQTPPHPPELQPQLPRPDTSGLTAAPSLGLPGCSLGLLSQPPDPALPLHVQLSQAHSLYVTQLHAQQVQLELQQAQLSAQAEQLLLLTQAVAAAAAASAAPTQSSSSKPRAEQDRGCEPQQAQLPQQPAPPSGKGCSTTASCVP